MRRGSGLDRTKALGLLLNFFLKQPDQSTGDRKGGRQGKETQLYSSQYCVVQGAVRCRGGIRNEASDSNIDVVLFFCPHQHPDGLVQRCVSLRRKENIMENDQRQTAR